MKEYIKKGSWNKRAFTYINKLIAKHGKDNPSYNPQKKPFAVFDWDNTSIIGDVEEATFYYLVTELLFKIDPYELNEIIRKNVDKSDFRDPYKNLDGNPVNIENLSADIYDVYKRLYGTSDRLGGDVPFEIIRETNAYKEFVTKMIFRYQATDLDKNAEDPYCWMTFLLTNYTKEEIYDLCDHAFTYIKSQKPRREIFTSPDIKSKTGRVEISYFVGMGDVPEMVDLYRTLEENGIDVYVVSASSHDIVRAYASKNSYKFNKNKVFGLRLAKDSDGKIIPKLDKSYPLTQKEGKSKAIRKLIQNENNYGPILVGGDSDGDYDMLTVFKESDLGIIIDVDRIGKINKLKKIALSGSDRYVLQARDKFAKTFIEEKRSI
ncbi:haloacid dehalogenase-like hydrolase [uncultured Anaerococcus sp.]|uniref:haloacid dehalogenase-like hydrolase n=1 Tax=uncultured Anaerococcus sp. TaxID=293428 RepID=UPI0025D7A413|nr:haloacid dehalogenase-like hydrolase [uncultured Anaerococcus sp.]